MAAVVPRRIYYRVYAALVGLALLTWGLHLDLERCYYAVVLSFLLVHYFHDHVLFSDTGEAELQAA